MQRLGGATLSVSYSCGRLDTVFPYLPYAVRSALRVDSTAAFSATDQATADKMTELLAYLAEHFLLLPGEGRGGLAANASVGVAAAPTAAATAVGLQQRTAERGPSEAQAAAVDDTHREGGAAVTEVDADDGGREQSGPASRKRLRLSPEEAQSQVSPPLPPLLLPLALTDGTACCGGNTLSLARRFKRVLAVELDAERADDLRCHRDGWAGLHRRRCGRQIRLG
ncbi:hypothetical protein GPECTOR_7g1109 [Gonium pectorale]|uniref:Uncharacterized protein n=1 Tax=Gonium pectorale TaxID=33097 RepID=A0A150GTL4_GONPE|nr:hypothetical protein GPECTOR_7g1109 [Gonium pectorale]|eukprot:KXZ53216.1 hypothetical protein GPECTOR_7g1109 [Gonium pectorale]